VLIAFINLAPEKHLSTFITHKYQRKVLII
jgi:hypothetical protein